MTNVPDIEIEFHECLEYRYLREMSLSDQLGPGDRLLLVRRFGLLIISITEVVALWPVSDGDWVLLGPRGDLFIHNADRLSHSAMPARNPVMRFTSPLSVEDLVWLIKTAQRHAIFVRGARAPPDLPVSMRQWDGTFLDLIEAFQAVTVAEITRMNRSVSSDQRDEAVTE